MRLNELKGYKNIIAKAKDAHTTSKNVQSGYYPNVRNYLEAEGLKEINAGTMGSVWDFGNPNWVLKIFKPDIGYEDWVVTSLKHKNNPFFPKFKSKLIDISGSNEVKGVVVERLVPITSEKYMFCEVMFELDEGIAFAKAHSGSSDMRDVIKDISVRHTVFTLYPHLESQHLEPEELDKQILQAIEKTYDTPFMQAFKIVIERAKQYFMDVDEPNVMLRGDQIVFTDPWLDLNQ